GHQTRFDHRVLGSVSNISHGNIGSAPMGSAGRPQLSLVPDRPELDAIAPLTPDDELWQEKALCAQTDPEAFFPEKGGSTREAKRICQGCEVRDACLDYALAHDERFGIWGGLSERERRRLKRGII
ncbi:transcription factor WhiB, partial [Mycobacteriaceae bacterium 1482268.1]